LGLKILVKTVVVVLKGTEAGERGIKGPKSKDLKLDVMLRVRHMCVITVIEC